MKHLQIIIVFGLWPYTKLLSRTWEMLLLKPISQEGRQLEAKEHLAK
jgi:hypothetical protein